jgi:hypothetical protein
VPRIAVVVLSIAALVVATVGTAVAGSPLPPGYSVAVRQAIYPGVDYERIVNPAGPVLAHVAHVAPGAAVDLRVVDSHDKIPTGPAELETTSSMCRRVQCVVAVNGDFHAGSQPVGGVVTGGRMVRSPDPSRAQLWVDSAGHLGAGPFPWSAGLRLSDGSRLPIAGVNVPTGAGPVLYTSAWGPATPPSGGIELVLAPAEAVGPLNRPVPVTLQGVRLSPGGIPAGGAVIAVPASAADQLNSVWARVQQGVVTVQAAVEVDTPVNALESLGTTPVVLHNGQRALPWPDDPNVVGALQPRTLVGWNAAGDVYFVVVDGREQSSAGLTMAQAADMLLGLGATEAANLDGGGGSTFVVGGTVWNQPNDDPTADPAVAERVASNALVLVPGIGGPPAPERPPRPGTGSDPGSPAAGGGSASPDTETRDTGPTDTGPTAVTAGIDSRAAVLGRVPPDSPPVSGPTPLAVSGPSLSATPADSGVPGDTALRGLLPRSGGTAPDRPAAASASSSAGPGRPGGADGAGGASRPLLALAGDGGLPAPVVPPGRAGGLIGAQCLFFAALWMRRRIRRTGP